MTIVVKLGGKSFDDARVRARHAHAIASLEGSAIIVHGGGAQITRALAASGVSATFVDGLRVTDEPTMLVVERTLTALGKELAQAVGARGLQMSGRDASLLLGHVKDERLGRVGTIDRVGVDALSRLLDAGFVPVVTPVAIAQDGAALNVNADEAASAIARALRVTELVLLTDVEGVRGADAQIVSRLDAAAARGLIDGGVATGGMIPKLNGALAALAGGVGAVRILSGERAEAFDEYLAGKSVGTRVEATK
ncbi:MAG: acetylglutamate kinase [Thermoplasmatota archaeon]